MPVQLVVRVTQQEAPVTSQSNKQRHASTSGTDQSRAVDVRHLLTKRSVDKTYNGVGYRPSREESAGGVIGLPPAVISNFKTLYQCS